MFKKLLLGIAGLLVVGGVGVAIAASMQPDTYRVERTATIAAPADIVWAQVADFSRWKNWSHWEKSDPSQKTTITGAAGTVGHMTAWKGEKTGEGTMTITDATAPAALAIELAFTAPMASVAKTDMKIVSAADGVTVTWAMDGNNTAMGKVMCLFMSMEDMIGGAYEDSLKNLKGVAEQEATARKAKAAAEAAAVPAAEPPAAPTP